MQDSILLALQRTNAYFHGIARRLINDGNPKMGMDLGWLGAWGWEGGWSIIPRFFVQVSCWDMICDVCTLRVIHLQ